MPDKRTMAIIKQARFGMDDFPTPALVLTVCLDEAYQAGLTFVGQAAIEIIKEYNVRDVHDLGGKPCWVHIDEKSGGIRWAGALVLK